MRVHTHSKMHLIRPPRHKSEVGDYSAVPVRVRGNMPIRAREPRQVSLRANRLLIALNGFGCSVRFTCANGTGA